MAPGRPAMTRRSTASGEDKEPFIQPLSLDASEMLFRSLCPSRKIDSRLHDLLRAVDCIYRPHGVIWAGIVSDPDGNPNKLKLSP